MENPGVTFQTKSPWQKDNCIVNGCTEESSLEAVVESTRVRVRSCTSEEHKTIAARLAVITAAAWKGNE